LQTEAENLQTPANIFSQIQDNLNWQTATILFTPRKQHADSSPTCQRQKSPTPSHAEDLSQDSESDCATKLQALNLQQSQSGSEEESQKKPHKNKQK
jgi:hypothetical protein